MCRCKKFPGIRTKSPTTHTLLTHHPSRNKNWSDQQVRPASASPQPAACRSDKSFFLATRGRGVVGERPFAWPLAHMHLGGVCVLPECRTLVLPHLRHLCGGLTMMPLPLRSTGFGLFDIVILRRGAVFQTCSHIRGSRALMQFFPLSLTFD